MTLSKRKYGNEEKVASHTEDDMRVLEIELDCSKEEIRVLPR